MKDRSSSQPTRNLFIIAAPSGSGKTTVARELMKLDSSLVASISATTRPPRPSERDEVDYFFLNDEEFENLVQAREFLEHAEVFGYRYGTLRTYVEKWLESKDVLLDIDWQGAKRIREQFTNARSFFLVPPSEKILRERLESREQDSEEVIDYRMSKAKSEMSHYREFDYVIKNDKLAETITKVHGAIVAVREGGAVNLEDISDEIESMLRSHAGSKSNDSINA